MKTNHQRLLDEHPHLRHSEDAGVRRLLARSLWLDLTGGTELPREDLERELATFGHDPQHLTALADEDLCSVFLSASAA